LVQSVVDVSQGVQRRPLTLADLVFALNRKRLLKAADRLRRANTPHHGAAHDVTAEHDAPVEGVLEAAEADEPVVEAK